MKTHWLEKTIFSWIRNTHLDGSTSLSISLLGWQIAYASPLLSTTLSGFRLSLYDLIIPYEAKGGIAHFKVIPLLRLLVGEHVTEELPLTEDILEVYINGNRYTITPLNRFRAFANLKRWHVIEKKEVYLIASPDDPDLPDYSFGHQSWEGRRPTANEVINQAHSLFKMTDGFKVGMTKVLKL